MNDKQRRFVQEYLVDLNATQAAIRAGYSAKTAYSQGQRLLKHVEVAAAIAKGKQKRSDALELTQDDVVRGLHEIASDSDAQTGARVSAWNLLGKHLAMFSEKHEHEHSGEVTLVVESAFAAAVPGERETAGAG